MNPGTLYILHFEDPFKKGSPRPHCHVLAVFIGKNPGVYTNGKNTDDTMLFDLVASEYYWFNEESFHLTESEIHAHPEDISEVKIAELPTYMHWPLKTPLFDRLLKGDAT